MIGLYYSHSTEMSQFSVVALAPREHLAVHGQSQRVSAPGMDGHFLHHILAECGQRPGYGHVTSTHSQTQTAVCSLTTRVDLPLLRD